ncbi:MAG: glycosyltransferase family 4 protein [Pseudomonadota bacterium]
MKILYSHRTRSADGQWVHISALAKALGARGHDVRMCGPDGADERMLDADSGGATASRLLPGSFYECAEYGYSVPAYLRLNKAAKEFQPDILYERYNLFFHAGAWLHKRCGVPMVLEVNAPLAEERAQHGGLSLTTLARKSEAAIWSTADKVLPVTHVLAEKVRAAGVPADRIAVVHNGVEQEFLEPRDPAPMRARYNLDGKLVLGFSGFVRDWHGVDRILHFLSNVHNRDLHLLIVGDGPARLELEHLARSLQIEDRLTITGVVQRDEVANHIAAFDIALQPAVVDYASPLKLFEYMAQGLPILAPDKPNINEVLTSGEDGLLFKPEELEKALSMLAGDDALRQRLGSAARETLVRRDFTWDGNARRVETIAEKLKGKQP